MFRKDFETGKFPISKRSPVIGYSKDRVSVAYNRKKLKELTIIPGILLIGIWPGKTSTDLFYINPEYYKDLPVPPAGHEDIDSAESISALYSDTDTFEQVEYRFADHTPIICKDKALLDYVKKAGIRHSIIIQKVG
jgi:hypothetical protein